MLFEEMIRDAESVPQNIVYKLENNLATLEDQDEALKDPESAFCFTYYIDGADIEKCQDAACKDPKWAFYFALGVKGANIKKCQKAAGKSPFWAYMFARHVRVK